MTATVTKPRRQRQADRRARTHGALLEAAARGLSRFGYGHLILEKVARDAGYSRGALYHLFANKEELALAVVDWVEQTWWAEMSPVIAGSPDPVTALKNIARNHAVFCRRDIARVRMVLSVEFAGRDHPVGRAVEAAMTHLIDRVTLLIDSGRENGSIPPGPPSRILAIAVLGAVEGLVINLSGQAPFDEELAERAVEGVLGLSS
jgi:AcrR family transcriptional regulator